MKKINSILFAFSLIFITSCDYLNVDDYFKDEIELDSVFSSKRNIEAYLWAIPSFFGDEGSLFQHAETPGPLATDEGFTMFETRHGYNGMRLVLGEINASSTYTFGDVWYDSYRVIRNCNTLFARIDEARDLPATDRAQVMGNARFFRAYAYYKLLLNYGPPILLGDEVVPSNESLEYYDRARCTYDEAVEYICQELETAAVNLPLTLPLMDFGRPTKGAAYGLIARLRLYHASPLFNGGAAAQSAFGNWRRSTDGVPYVSLTYDEKRWAIAAAAAKRVKDLQSAGGPMYRLHTVEADSETPELPNNVTSDPNFYNTWPNGAAGLDHLRSYSEMFTGEAVIPTNPEYVWARRSGTLEANTQMSFPAKAGGWSGLCVTQKVIDAFSMVDGRTIDNSSSEYPYSESGFTTSSKTFSGYRLNSGVFNMYTNREMRFYATIGFSECFWPMSSATSSGHFNRTITYYFDAENGKSNNQFDYPPTGYVIKKYIHPEDAWEGTNARRMAKAYPMIRYADILLMYAEALNNLTSNHTVELGGETYTLQRDINEIRNAFNPVRYRAGMPGLTDSELASASTIQELLVKERMIEFLYENHRYYDVRRWGIYEKVENEPIVGMNADGNKDAFYSKVIPNTVRIGTRVVNKKLMLLPIPLSEIYRLPSLDQNPGWED